MFWQWAWTTGRWDRYPLDGNYSSEWFPSYLLWTRRDHVTDEPLKAHIDKVRHTRAAYIEKFSAAFLEDVGSAEASKYYLKETQDISDPKKIHIKWSFELR